MSDVFISYSRKDIAFAQLLHRALEENGFDTWIDWQDIPPSTDWLAEVFAAIEASDNFIFIISHTSVQSEVCGFEIEHALKNNKRLIPVVIEEVEPGKVPRSVRGLNWIFFGEQGEAFRKASQDLNIAIKTDYEWVKAHTRLQTRALEWDREARESGYLLRGGDLRAAEGWLSRALGKDPQPTALQAEYIHTSRAAVARRTRITLAGVAVAILVALGLGWLAMNQRAAALRERQVRATAQAEAVLEAEARATAQAVAEVEGIQRATAQAEAALEAEARATAQLEAAQKAELAYAQQVAAYALDTLDEYLDLSLLLSVEALHIADTLETRGSLLEGLMYSAKIDRYLRSDSLPGTDSLIPFQTFRCAFHPDGALVACSLSDDAIQVWEASTGKQVRVLSNGGEGEITALAFSPDGSVLAAGDEYRLVHLWDTENWELVGEPLSGPESRVCEECWLNDYGINSLTFRNDGRELAAGCANGDILRWDLATGDLIVMHYGSLNVETSTYQASTFSPDGDRLATTHSEPVVYVYDVESGEELARSANLLMGMPGAIRFSEDGTRLAVAGWQNKVFILDAATLEVLVGPLEGHTESVQSLAFSPDGSQLATSGNDQRIILWEVESGEMVGTPLLGHTDTVDSLVFSPDGSHLVSLDRSQATLLWDLSGRPGPMGTWFPVDGGVDALAYQGDSQEGRLVIDSRFEPLVFQMDISQGEPGPVVIALEEVKTVTLSDDGIWAVVGDEDYNAYVFDTRDASLVAGPIPKCYSDRQAASTQSNLLLVGNIESNSTRLGFGAPRQFSICDITTGLPLGDPLGDYTGLVSVLRFGPGGFVLASGSFEGEVSVWALGDYPPRELVLSTKTPEEEEVEDLAFSPDGSLLAATRGYVSVWQLDTGNLLWSRLVSPGGDSSAVAFSPDGTLLASASGAGTPLWDLESGQLIGTPLVGGGRAVVFSQDGRLLFIGKRSGVDIWQMEIEDWVAAACRIVSRSLTEAEWSTYLPDRPYRQTCEGFE